MSSTCAAVLGGIDRKRRHYADVGVAAGYEKRRFGGGAGAQMSNRELDVALSLLPPLAEGARILDLPAGTGRLLSRLWDGGFHGAVGADFSAAMLLQARQCRGPPLIRADAFALPFRDRSFAAAACLRFLFHFRDPAPILRELCRVLQPGGIAIFDTLRWSPRSVLPRLQRPLGGEVHPAGEDQTRRQLEEAGLELLEVRRELILPSQAYRYLPGFAFGPLSALERALPDTWRAKCFWKARRRGSSAS
jgi:ubiquinone/menaquinone biosynthesis C-methylase UbiE